MDVSVLLLVSALLPFVLLLGYKLEGRKADGFAIAITGLSLIFNVAALLVYRMGSVYHYSILSAGNVGEVFGILTDTASVLVGLVTAIVSFLVVVYTADYVVKAHAEFPVEGGKGKFYALLGLLIGSTMTFIYGTNMVQFIVSLELMAIALSWLIDFYGNAPLDAIKSFLVLNIGVVLMLIALAMLGNHQALSGMRWVSAGTKRDVMLLVTFAAFAMSSQFFFYSWLPKSTKGPVPVSAIIHSVSVTAMGVFLLFRIIQYLGPYKHLFYVLVPFSVLMILLMMIYYPIQSDSKTLIAYSTISQAAIGYMTLAYAAYGSSLGLQIATYQVINHAFVKALAFLTVGAMSYSLGTTDMRSIRGLAHTLPAVSTSWFLSFFGLAGVLPLGMFFAKAYESMTNAHAPGIYSWLLPTLILFDAAILFVVVMVWFRRMFFGEAAKPEPVNRPTWPMYASMLALIVIGTVSPWVTIDLVSKIGFMGGL
ncbi:MAG: sodium:proton antiporter [Thermococci archaeon]|nr:sodium:proton antiporter [Thermococci archaeon]